MEIWFYLFCQQNHDLVGRASWNKEKTIQEGGENSRSQDTIGARLKPKVKQKKPNRYKPILTGLLKGPTQLNSLGFWEGEKTFAATHCRT